MASRNAEQYLQLFANDAPMRKSLMACAAALSLDDEEALQAIRLVLVEPAKPSEILPRIKQLGCVWHSWDGSWRISEDVRVGLTGFLSEELPSDCLNEIRSRLVQNAELKVAKFSPDGQITNYRTREAHFQVAYQKLFLPGQLEEGANLFVDVWRRATPDARVATCSAADYLTNEIQRPTKSLPTELLFMKGMAARVRKDWNGAREYFYLVWKQGKPGDIYAIAAHLFGNLSKSHQLAESAYRDSLEWYPARQHHAHVYHSLGNLLSRQSRRWKEAEQTYHTSLELSEDDPSGKAQVYHSLGNLLSRQSRRWKEAEQAYETSLRLNQDRSHQAQVYHSLANLLSRQGSRWKEAEKAYHISLKLSEDDPSGKARVYHSLGNLLSRRGSRWKEAEKAYRTSLKLEDDPSGNAQVYHSLGNLLSRQGSRWKEAEQAYRKSLELRHDASHQGQAWHSLGNLLSRQHNRWDEAEQAYLKSLQLLQDPSDQAQVYHSVGKLLSRQNNRVNEAEQAYRESLQLSSDVTDHGLVWHSLGDLLSRQNNRWKEAEQAYLRSLQLVRDPADQAQIYSSWAGAIVATRRAAEYSKAEDYAMRALALGSEDLRCQSTVNGVLAKLHVARGNYKEAIAALTAAIKADERLKNWKLAKQRQQQLKTLHEKI